MDRLSAESLLANSAAKSLSEADDFCLIARKEGADDDKMTSHNISLRLQIVGRGASHTWEHIGSAATWPNQSSHSKEETNRRTNEESKYGNLALRFRTRRK